VKVDDFDHPDTHNPIRVEPKLQKDVDVLKAMYDTFSTSMESAQDNLQLGQILTGTIDREKLAGEVKDIASFLKFIFAGPGSGDGHKWSGIACCTSCCRKSVFLLRDAAQALENMLDEVDKRSDWPPVNEGKK